MDAGCCTSGKQFENGILSISKLSGSLFILATLSPSMSRSHAISLESKTKTTETVCIEDTK